MREVAFPSLLPTSTYELEGALNRDRHAKSFTGRAITIDFVREALRDFTGVAGKLVTIDNIQKTVAEHYKIKLRPAF